jgi:hypothetical protein
MSGAAWMQLAFLLVLLAISTPLLGSYMAKVHGGGRAPADRFFLPIERFVYRLCRIDPKGSSAGAVTSSRCCSSASSADCSPTLSRLRRPVWDCPWCSCVRRAGWVQLRTADRLVHLGIANVSA